MATTAQCLYCFETLSASLEKQQQPLDLKRVEELFHEYQRSVDQLVDDDDQEVDPADDAGVPEHEVDDDEGQDQDSLHPSSAARRILRPKDVSRLQTSSPASGSLSSTPSTHSAASSSHTPVFSDASKSSSKSSFFSSFSRRSPVRRGDDEYPLFITWNTIGPRGHKSLRGCIGTFEPQELASGLRSYALTSAFDDSRFSPITSSELSSLSCSITLLLAFTPCEDALDWELGTHGIRISFSHRGKRYGATYLPDVAVEQGWTKEETVVSLMRKAGWYGRSHDWRNVSDMRCVRYQGKKASVGYQAWREWRDWVEAGFIKTR